eukprot:scaffold7220_cov403-Prasinococcus_capsulatus_cf.AAC.1
MGRLLELKYAAAMGTAASSYGEVSRVSRPLLVVAADMRTRRSYSAFGIGLVVHPPLLAGLGVTADLASGERGRGSGRGCRTSRAKSAAQAPGSPVALPAVGRCHFGARSPILRIAATCPELVARGNPPRFPDRNLARAFMGPGVSPRRDPICAAALAVPFAARVAWSGSPQREPPSHSSVLSAGDPSRLVS